MGVLLCKSPPIPHFTARFPQLVEMPPILPQKPRKQWHEYNIYNLLGGFIPAAYGKCVVCFCVFGSSYVAKEQTDGGNYSKAHTQHAGYYSCL